MICQNCGCSKPCACDQYTHRHQSMCIACGCTKPCMCDHYTRFDENDCSGVFDGVNTVYSDADPGL